MLFDKRDVEVLADRKKVIKSVVNAVAEALANTPAVCRKSYVHPGLLAAYETGEFPQLFHRFRPQRKGRTSRDELIFARFLRRWKPGKTAG